MTCPVRTGRVLLSFRRFDHYVTMVLLWWRERLWSDLLPISVLPRSGVWDQPKTPKPYSNPCRRNNDTTRKQPCYNPHLCVGPSARTLRVHFVLRNWLGIWSIGIRWPLDKVESGWIVHYTNLHEWILHEVFSSHYLLERLGPTAPPSRRTQGSGWPTSVPRR
jgi:hypothetical protein